MWPGCSRRAVGSLWEDDVDGHLLLASPMGGYESRVTTERVLHQAKASEMRFLRIRGVALRDTAHHTVVKFIKN